jgi:hypothetical protein
MGAFGDIGTRGLLFDAQQRTSPRATGFLGLWGLGCRGMTAEVSKRRASSYCRERWRCRRQIEEAKTLIFLLRPTPPILGPQASDYRAAKGDFWNGSD